MGYYDFFMHQQTASKENMENPYYEVQNLTALNMQIFGAVVIPFASISLFIGGK